MTTYVPFLPSTIANFQFQPTLDGKQYTAIITWNLFGARYYLNLYDLQGNLVIAIPMVGSPDNYDISLVKGYFTTSTLIFRESTQQFEISP